MKVLVSFLCTRKYDERIEVCLSGAVRSHSGKHEVIYNAIAEGSKPSFFNPNWNWIESDNIKIAHRHLKGLEIAIDLPDIDFVIFCDDDVVIDIDNFIEQALPHQNIPSCWGTDLGMGCSPALHNSLSVNAGKFLEGRDACKEMHISFCTAIINRKYLDLVRENRDIILAVRKISEEFWDNCLSPDVQICIMSYLLKANMMHGHSNNASCFPFVLSSSLMCNSGNNWHIHGFRPFSQDGYGLKKENAINAIKKGRQDKEKLMTTLFPEIEYGFKAKDYIDTNLRQHIFWIPWSGFRRNLDYIKNMENTSHLHSMMFSSRKYIKDSGQVSGGLYAISEIRECEWQACEGGLKVIGNFGTISFNHTIRDENAIIGLLDNHPNSPENSTIFGIWKI